MTVRQTQTGSSEHRDGGFTLVESLVAVLVLLVLVGAFGGLMSAALRSARVNHTTQIATAVAMEHVERARSLSWTELAMSSVDSGAPMLASGGTSLLGSEVGLPSNETLVVDAAGVIAPSNSTTVDSATYTVWQYVTEAGPGLRRVVVLVTWSFGEATLSHQASALISEVATR